MEKEKYYIDVKVPKFVKRYLVVNFGVSGKNKDCFNIREDRTLYVYLKTLLSKNSHQYDSRIDTKKWRTEKIRIEITEKDFNTRGHELSQTAENNFVYYLEVRCRMIMLVYISSYKYVIPGIAECIKEFYKVTGWSEETWPSVSIRKIIDRQKKKLKNSIMKHNYTIFDEINNIIVTTLSQNKTITNNAKNLYEYNAKQL